MITTDTGPQRTFYSNIIANAHWRILKISSAPPVSTDPDVLLRRFFSCKSFVDCLDHHAFLFENSRNILARWC